MCIRDRLIQLTKDPFFLLQEKIVFRKVLCYPLSQCLSICLFVCLSVCPEDFSGTAGWNGTNCGMCIHDHPPLILQRDEGHGHKVKKLTFGEGVCERSF